MGEPGLGGENPEPDHVAAASSFHGKFPAQFIEEAAVQDIGATIASPGLDHVVDSLSILINASPLQLSTSNSGLRRGSLEAALAHLRHDGCRVICLAGS